VTTIEKLRYVRLGVEDPAVVGHFATRILGLQRIDAPEGLQMFRSDSRDHTLALFQREGGPGDQTLALEVRSSAALDDLCDRLAASGYQVERGSAEECAARRCRGLAWFTIRDAVRIELVLRPQDSGWRYFGSRDAGITEFFGVAFASTDVEADTALWTEIFGGKIADYVGDAVYVALDDEHHRIAIHPSNRDAILEVQFRVEGLQQLMQNNYFMQSAQVAIVSGPGRRPASGELFLTFKGPDGVLFGFVAEGDRHPFNEDRVPRQFPHANESFCAWGSHSTVPEYSAGL